MSAPRHIAVLDVGKSNVKLALVAGTTLQEIAVLTQPNRVISDAGPWPHFDLEAIWSFFLAGLTQFQTQHGVDAISTTTHGASIVLLDKDGRAIEMLDYEHTGPDDLTADYDAIRPEYAQTGSPRLPAGLNVGAQLHWMLQTDPTLRDRIGTILTYPQYWGARLTGVMACDATSLGCHTDLWNPFQGVFSALPGRLGLEGLMAPVRSPGARLGQVTPQVATKTGLPPQTPVHVGIHDSNASLLPHLLRASGPVGVVSTGTWVIAMAIDGEGATLDPHRDVLVNVSATGRPTPTARFMGGREFDLAMGGVQTTPTAADRQSVRDGLYFLPSLAPGTGPFPDRAATWTRPARTQGERYVALSYYLALMTECCLSLAGAQGPTVVEGPFSGNRDYLAMLRALRASGVQTTGSQTGTSLGAALLVGARLDAAPPPRPVEPSDHRDALLTYAREWTRLVNLP